MAYLTDLQKQGIGDLLQDWPIYEAGEIDLDMMRPKRIFEAPVGEINQDPFSRNMLGFVLNPYGKNAKPPLGPPFGLSKAYGTDPFAYIQDLEKFQPEWTPGATEEGRLNKEIAETIGHEGRHHYFQKKPEILEDMRIDELRTQQHNVEETYSQFLDSLARNEDEISFPIQKELLNYINLQKKPGIGAFGIHGIQSVFNKMREKYLNSLRRRGGPSMSPRPRSVSLSTRPQAPIGRPIQPGGGGGAWSPSGADLSPGGGYGQSPTGSDIAGTPFSRGGILGAF